MDGDFSFMRSGVGTGVETGEVDVETMRMIVSLMTVLLEEATSSGVRFARACGRQCVTGRDIVAALKYEAHFFWNKDVDSRFGARLQAERQHTYDTDDEGDDESEDDRDAVAEEEYTDALVDSNEARFHEDVTRVCAEWSAWDPADPAKRLLKRAIDKTERDVEHGADL